MLAGGGGGGGGRRMKKTGRGDTRSYGFCCGARIVSDMLQKS